MLPIRPDSAEASALTPTTMVPVPAARRRSLLAAPLVGLSLLLAHPAANAALEVGAVAPEFRLPAATAGQVSDFVLSDALKRGPVVLYFFPAAFSYGCNREAHAFAEHIEEYKALGATVIGVSNDTIDVISKFSVQECAGKFSVAADPEKKVIGAYDSKSFLGGADRTSYVIDTDGKIHFVYSAMLSFAAHIDNTLQALRTLKGGKAADAGH